MTFYNIHVSLRHLESGPGSRSTLRLSAYLAYIDLDQGFSIVRYLAYKL